MNATILKDFELTDCEWCEKETQWIWVELRPPYPSEDQGIGHWECAECHTWTP